MFKHFLLLSLICFTYGLTGEAMLLGQNQLQSNGIEKFSSGHKLLYEWEERPEIFTAIKSNDVEKVKEYIDSGVDIDAIIRAGDSILTYTLWQSPINTEILEIILSANANVDARDNNNYTPLMMAARAYRDEVTAAEILLKHNADIEAKMADDITALFMAVQKGNIKVVELLISHGAEVNIITGNYYSSPISYAAAESGTNSLELVKILLKAGSQVDPRDVATGRTPLCNAEDVEIAKCLIDNGADVNMKDKEGYTPLMLSSHSDKVIVLLSHGADVNAKSNTGVTALMLAIEETAIKRLISAGADVNAKDNSGSTAILYKETISFYKILTLANAGADVNVKDAEGKTALMVASSSDIVKALVGSKADVDAVDMNGMTALLYYAQAYLFNDADVVAMIDVLGKAKANFKVEDKDGNSVLHYIVRDKPYNYEELADTCLSYGADINAQNNAGDTALMWASIMGHSKLVSYLTNAGADASMANTIGYTADMMKCACNSAVTKSGLDRETLVSIEPMMSKLYCFNASC